MIRRHLAGDANPVRLLTDREGVQRAREERTREVHATNERWVSEHGGKSLSAIVALGQEVRAETLALVASLSDEQLGEELPLAPWADTTIGGVIAVNADHGRQHYRWILEGMAQNN